MDNAMCMTMPRSLNPSGDCRPSDAPGCLARALLALYEVG